LGFGISLFTIGQLSGFSQQRRNHQGLAGEVVRRDMGQGTGTERVVGRGTGDGMNWEGEALAEPNLSANREIGKSASRETAAISDW
jgi:hypothetical protein